MDQGWAHCGRCDQDKPRDAFYKNSWAPNSLRKPCKQCLSDRRRQRYRDNNGVDESYEQVLKRDYGITLAQYNELLRKQAGRCAICRRGETAKMRSGRLKRMAVDHDHVTGMVRGLLCHRCNLTVWALEDNHTTIEAVRQYIEKWQETFANGAPL